MAAVQLGHVGHEQGNFHRLHLKSQTVSLVVARDTEHHALVL